MPVLIFYIQNIFRCYFLPLRGAADSSEYGPVSTQQCGGTGRLIASEEGIGEVCLKYEKFQDTRHISYL